MVPSTMETSIKTEARPRLWGWTIKLFSVLFIHVIYLYYFLSRQRLMLIFKAFRNGATRVQLDLIVSDLHTTPDECHEKKHRSAFLVLFYLDHSYAFPNINSTPSPCLNLLSAPQRTAADVLSMQNIQSFWGGLIERFGQ